MRKSKKQPFYSKSSSGLSNSIFIKICLKLCTSDGSTKPTGSLASISRDWGNAEKSSNPKSAGKPVQVSKFNICGSKERYRALSCG